MGLSQRLTEGWPFPGHSLNCPPAFSRFLARALWGNGRDFRSSSRKTVSHFSQVYPMVTAAVPNSWVLQEAGQGS